MKHRFGIRETDSGIWAVYDNKRQSIISKIGKGDEGKKKAIYAAIELNNHFEQIEKDGVE